MQDSLSRAVKRVQQLRALNQKLKHKDTIRIAVITAGDNGSLSMITKGRLNTVIRSLAIEYAKEGIRFKAVAIGVVDTPMHKHDSKEFPKTLQPMRKNSGLKRHRRCHSLPVRGRWLVRCCTSMVALRPAVGRRQDDSRATRRPKRATLSCP